MAAEQRFTSEIYVPLNEGAPSFEDGIIEQALPDWNKSSREESGFEGHVSYVTFFSREFNGAKVQLVIVRNIYKDDKIAVGFGLIDENLGLDTSFNIWEAYSLTADPFNKSVSFQGVGDYGNAEIQVQNGGFVSCGLSPVDSNVTSFINFRPKQDSGSSNIQPAVAHA